MVDKFVETFSDETTRRLTIPVVPTLGNNDILPHNILLPGPNRWLQYYTDIWKPFIPEEQRHSFEFGGWFYVEVIPNRLAVFSLNTLYFFDRNAAVDDCAATSEPGYKQLEWLRIQLSFMRKRGMKAILTGHVPPARTDSKQLWDETCWQKYTLWLKQYRDVVVSGLYGHMNIDHFLLQDTKDIDLDFLDGDVSARVSIREAMEDELSIQSTTDYLQELRSGWAKLPKPEMSIDDDPGHAEGGKGHKKKKKHWAERYQLSLVSPSIVPNYFPTLRVVEYNISGLGKAKLWRDSQGIIPPPSQGDEESQARLELRSIPSPDDDTDETAGKRKKPHFVIPDPPAKGAPPGPAYSPQPLSLTGFVQYYANLTHINNDMTPDDPEEPTPSTWADWLLRWRRGKHGGKNPKNPNQPQPRKFEYKVEYSTFKDSVYNLTDLTVSSFVKLAYRIGQTGAGNKDLLLPGPKTKMDWESETVDDDEASAESDSDSDAEDEVETKKKRRRKKGNKPKWNKVWLHFLRHAFVNSVDKEDLKKL
jgi:endopolyphosphatase